MSPSPLTKQREHQGHFSHSLRETQGVGWGLYIPTPDLIIYSNCCLYCKHDKQGYSEHRSGRVSIKEEKLFQTGLLLVNPSKD